MSLHVNIKHLASSYQPGRSFYCHEEPAILLAPEGIRDFLHSVQNPEESTKFLATYSLFFAVTQCFEPPVSECSTLSKLTIFEFRAGLGSTGITVRL